MRVVPPTEQPHRFRTIGDGFTSSQRVLIPWTWLTQHTVRQELVCCQRQATHYRSRYGPVTEASELRSVLCPECAKRVIEQKLVEPQDLYPGSTRSDQ